ncbi:MAG TPA: acyl transferase [Chitinophagaceae bacterium]|nr:acyl transferase [Chitinophagaceae bacterium]
MGHKWNHKIFGLNEGGFEETALEIFRFQYENNPLYRSYVDSLHINCITVKSIDQIPFLPVSLFKSHEIKTTQFEPDAIFESSGTTGSSFSRHFVKKLSLYIESFTLGFQSFYGPPSDWCILGLLPSYLERKSSSLVYMVDQLMKQSKHPANGFYLDEYERLYNTLKQLEQQKQKTLLFGVTFALLDFAEKYPMYLQNIIIIETGGMKGRREEMIREMLHSKLKKAFNISQIHSEYGMTELLSQAWSKKEGIFYTPSWMRVLVREEEDPFSVKKAGRGIINIIDLANVYSCSFIATDDAGIINEDGGFEVLGRVDGSDIRGCSLMYV